MVLVEMTGFVFSFKSLMSFSFHLCCAVSVPHTNREMGFGLHTFLATTVAIAVARRFSDSFFDQLIQQRSLPFVPALTTKTEQLVARDIMCRAFGTAAPAMSVREIREFLADDPSHLPVVPIANPYNANEFLGTIDRQDLVRLVNDFARHHSHRHRHHHHDDDGNGNGSASPPLDERQLRLPITRPSGGLVEDTPASILHHLLVSEGLRHLIVTREGVAVGIITRDLLKDALDSRADHSFRASYCSRWLAT